MINKKTKIRSLLSFLLLLGLVILIWCISIYATARSSVFSINSSIDPASLLFGAASLALFMFSIFMASLGFFRWQEIERLIRDNVDESMTTKFAPLENETRGRMFSLLGHMVGRGSIGPDLIPRDRDTLAEAVGLCRLGYNLLKEVGGSAEYMGLNNLIFYSCLLDDVARCDFILSKAKLLLEVAQEHNASSLILTACRAILQYDPSPEQRKRARNILLALRYEPLSHKERKEIDVHLATFPE